MTTTETLKLALEALELHGEQYPHMVKGYCLDAITALREALASQGEALTSVPDWASEAIEKPAQTDEKGRPMTYWGGKVEQPTPQQGQVLSRIRMERTDAAKGERWWNEAAGIRMPSPDLHKQGDTILCWVNEGDYYAQMLTSPPTLSLAQRQARSADTWVNATTWRGLTDEEIDQGLLRSDYAFKTAEAWRAGVVFAMTKLKEKNCG